MANCISNKRYICVNGYGWSGSGACVDLLREFQGFSAFQGEFRIVKDPYGLTYLEDALVHNWDFIRHDIAIKDFLNYCEFLSRTESLFGQMGKDFSNKLDIDFLHESRLYIDRLVSIKYLGNSSIHRYGISSYKNFIVKVKSKLGISNAQQMYLARPTKDIFIEETNKYIDKLFHQYEDTVVLDQAIAPTNILNASKYFSDIKMIIIDRDPRDIYANMVKRNKLLGPELENSNSVDKYIEWHKSLRLMSTNDSNNVVDVDRLVLRLNFEDIILKYDESIEKIIKFLNKGDIHDRKKMYFFPNQSVKNIGLWKKYKDQSVMSRIGFELREYCYDA
jgi:hypothetical protein